MKKGIARILVSFVFFLTLFLVQPEISYSQGVNQSVPKRAEAVIVNVIENSEIIEPTGNKHPYQKLELLGTSGEIKGKKIIAENGKHDQTGLVQYSKGDKIVISLGRDFNGNPTYTITDYVRRLPLYLLLFSFIFLAVLVGGVRGITSLVGMVVSFAILFLFILPQISNGADPLTTTILASLVIIPVTFTLSHGPNRKTLCAVVATCISLIVSGLISAWFVSIAHLSGFSSEEINFLQIAKQGAIDVHGLLLAGIIIGLLGILQDITISQASIVYELKKANPKLNTFQLFKKAMNVGRDHIASMTNTMILVYAGVSLPLLLLFIDNSLPFDQIINFELIAEEIIRTLTSSIGLILAVPITTLLTALYIEFTEKKRAE